MGCDGFSDSAVTVFCDGSRSDADKKAVAAVREVARDMLGPDADVRASDANQGLARSIIAGVTEMVERHGRVIVVEDDFDLAPGFLTFLNAGLDRFADDPRVFQISGHMFDVPEFADRQTALFLPMTTSWGWATWDRAWRQFDSAAVGWQALLTDRALRKRFNLNGTYDYAAMMQRQMEGKRDSWAIRWYWSVFQAGGMALFPPRSLVRNTGQDGSGTHGGGKFRGFTKKAGVFGDGAPQLPVSGSLISPEDVTAVYTAIWKQNGGWRGSLVDLIKRLVVRR